MPVQSEKQRRFMYASLAGKTDVPPSVAKKFVGPSAHKAEGGTVKESKAMREKEVSFMKKKGAPKSMVKHEMAEAKGYASGGGIREAKTVTKTGTPQEEFAPNYRTPVRSPGISAYAKGGGVESRGKTKGKVVKMASGGESFPGGEGYNPYAKGGMTKKFASGGESNPGKEGYNPYAKGGSCYARGGGIESKGKTRGKFI